MATMHDVARLAGVSQSTVSHFVNGTRPIHPDTAAAIERAIREVGYVHDGLARSLRTGRSDTVGLAISALTNPYFGALVRRIESRVTEAGRTVLLVDTHDEAERELRAVEQLLRHRPDAVLLAPAEDESAALDLLVRRGIPTVVIDRVLPRMPDHVDAIGVTNREPMRQLVDHLGGLGHRHIALLASLAGISTTTERVEGFHDGLRSIGQDPTGRVEHLDHDPAATRDAIARLFEVDPRPTAVIGGNNQATIAILRWLLDQGLDVPGDVSLAGFDDFEWSDLFHPRLTAIRQPVEELADRAGELLDRRIADPDADGLVVRVEPRLIVRDSAVRVG